MVKKRRHNESNLSAWAKDHTKPPHRKPAREELQEELRRRLPPGVFSACTRISINAAADKKKQDVAIKKDQQEQLKQARLVLKRIAEKKKPFHDRDKSASKLATQLLHAITLRATIGGNPRVELILRNKKGRHKSVSAGAVKSLFATLPKSSYHSINNAAEIIAAFLYVNEVEDLFVERIRATAQHIRRNCSAAL